MLREFPPGIAWQQVETEHFRIVYEAGYEAVAENVAAIAEPIHTQVTDFLRHAPASKTTVVLTDHVDFVNGYASPMPRNRIVLLLREPGAGDALFGLRSPDWLALVFTHEYIHIVHLDMVNGPLALARNVFGRIIFPNVDLGMWMIEGLAVYGETKFQNGRGRHPAYDMFIRADVLDDRFKTLEQMAVIGQRAWPLGMVHYVYGYFFLQYLADTYGEDSIVELSLYNSRKLPLQQNIFKKVYDGKDVGELWEEWRDAMQARYGRQIDTLSAAPLTATTPLSDSGYATNSPVFSPDGEYVYYEDVGGHDASALIRYRLSDGTAERLVRAGFSGNLDLSPDGRTVYFSRVDAYRAYFRYGDLYAFDVDTRKQRRLTRGRRVTDVAAAPDGKTLAFTTTQAGRASLWQMDIDSGAITPLWQPDDHTQMFHPDYAPDGAKLTLAVWREGGFQDIYIMNRDGSGRRALMTDIHTDSSPSWGPDGATVFFSSDRTGVPNLFAYDVETGSAYQITNVLTGAFDPAVSPDGTQLACEIYSSTGLDIHSARIDRAAWRTVTLEHEPLPDAALYQAAELDPPLAPRPYSAFSSALPTFWMPEWGTDEAGYQLGAATANSDILAEHDYTVMALYGLESERFSLFGRYTNRQFFPEITLFGSDAANGFGKMFTGEDGDDETYWQREQTAGLTIGIPLYVTKRAMLGMSTGYRYTEMTALTPAADLTPTPDQGTLSGASVGLEFRNLDASLYAIAPESGVTASLTYRRDDAALGSEYDLNTVVADARAYVEMPAPLRHHVLALRLSGGVSEGDTLRQGLFQLGGFQVDSERANLERRRYALRGYEHAQYSGNRVALGSAEYRLPLWYPQRGIADGLLFFDSLVAVGVYDVGAAWDGELESADVKHGVGGEMRLNFSVMQGVMPLTLRLGYARGLDDDDGQSQFIYGINMDLWL